MKDWLIIKNGVLIHCSANASGEMVIPSSVTCIGYKAFAYCSSLTSITIPDSVTSIQGNAFYNCTGLTSITIPNSVISIGYNAFCNCIGLTSITIGNSVTSIGDWAFDCCTRLKSINIPDSIISIGHWTFHNCRSLYSCLVEKEKIIAYKGFNNIDGELICRNKMYSLTELNTEPKAKICKCGIHACMLPIDVLNYYNSGCVYKVEMSGKFDYKDNDSKICATEMRILERIDRNDLVKETIKVLNSLK